MSATPDKSSKVQRLQALVEQLKTDYAQLFHFMEQTLLADPETEISQSLAFQAPIEELMRKTDDEMELFRELTEPWGQRRGEYPADLVAETDKFLHLLNTGLEGIKNQVDHRVEDLHERQDKIQEKIKRLEQQRQGVKGYKQKPGPGRFNSKA